MSLPDVGKHYAIYWGSEWNKNADKGEHPLPDCGTWQQSLPSALRVLRLELQSTPLSPMLMGLWTLPLVFLASPVCWWQTVGLLSLQYPMSQYHLSIPAFISIPVLYLSLCISIALPLVLFLWRTLTHTSATVDQLGHFISRSHCSALSQIPRANKNDHVLYKI